MLKDVVRGEVEEFVRFELAFDDGRGNGFAFPCDENGKVPDDLNEAARKNLATCLAHKERFSRFNEVVAITMLIRNPNKGRCECGNTVSLENQYMGACQCGKCGRWYNMSGQELLPPDEWGWDGTPMEEDW